MIYIDKCRTDLGVTVDEWAVDDRCRFSDSGKVGIGTGVRVLDITDKFGDVPLVCPFRTSPPSGMVVASLL